MDLVNAPADTWALGEHARRFDLGHVLNCAVIDAIKPRKIGELSIHHAGLWECDLRDGSLIWSGGVYDIFGLERGTQVTREQALACYTEDSRAKLERLRSYALRHQKGFTLDIEIRVAAVGELRRVRLIGAPVREQNDAPKLHGLKLAL
jgi:hypothetical protein